MYKFVILHDLRMEIDQNIQKYLLYIACLNQICLNILKYLQIFDSSLVKKKTSPVELEAAITVSNDALGQGENLGANNEGDGDNDFVDDLDLESFGKKKKKKKKPFNLDKIKTKLPTEDVQGNGGNDFVDDLDIESFVQKNKKKKKKKPFNLDEIRNNLPPEDVDKTEVFGPEQIGKEGAGDDAHDLDVNNAEDLGMEQVGEEGAGDDNPDLDADLSKTKKKKKKDDHRGFSTILFIF